MTSHSAGILPYRLNEGCYQVLLVHPGGPFWVRKDLGAWSIAKGGCAAGEEPLAAALRECAEETGYRPSGPFLPLARRRQRSGKWVDAWACAGDWDVATLVSNTCRIEWPPHSGRQIEVPEVDRAEWFDFAAAMHRIVPGQRGFLEELYEKLHGVPWPAGG